MKLIWPGEASNNRLHLSFVFFKLYSDAILSNVFLMFSRFCFPITTFLIKIQCLFGIKNTHQDLSFELFNISIWCVRGELSADIQLNILLFLIFFPLKPLYLPLLSPSGATVSFSFKRKQFPIKEAFCMTINKAHGENHWPSRSKFTRAGLQSWPVVWNLISQKILQKC